MSAKYNDIFVQLYVDGHSIALHFCIIILELSSSYKFRSIIEALWSSLFLRHFRDREKETKMVVAQLRRLLIGAQVLHTLEVSRI